MDLAVGRADSRLPPPIVSIDTVGRSSSLPGTEWVATPESMVSGQGRLGTDMASARSRETPGKHGPLADVGGLLS